MKKEHRSSYMSLLTKDYPQTISHWTKGDKDVYGKPTWSGPVSLSGLWEVKQETIIDVNGREIVSKASVFLNSSVAIGDFLYLGTIDSSELDPATVDNAWEVKVVFVNTSILNTDVQTIEAKL